jgi:hypothetical protein
MYGYLIDPFARTVTQVERTAETSRERLQEIYALTQCATVDAIRPENSQGDVMYVDDDGLERDEQAFFFCRLFPYQAIAGRALWTGTTPQGNDRDPRSTLAHVIAHTVWLDPAADRVVFEL